MFFANLVEFVNSLNSVEIMKFLIIFTLIAFSSSLAVDKDSKNVISSGIQSQSQIPSTNVREVVLKSNEGQSVTLTCNSNNGVITWRREHGERFAIGVNQNDAIITITKVGREDRGKYFCRSGMEVDGDLLSIVKLEITFSPQLFAFGLETEHKIGENAELLCGAISFPISNITWYKNGVKIVKTDNIEFLKRVNYDEIESFLKIKKMNENDFGEYNCEAENEFGKDQITLKLNKIWKLLLLLRLMCVYVRHMKNFFS